MIPTEESADTFGGGRPADRSGPAVVLMLAALAVAGAALLFALTRFGIGLSPDSAKYIQASRGPFEGRGLTVLAADGGWQPLNQFPPFFPLVLALLRLLGLDAPVGARVLNVSLFGVNILLVGLLIRRVTGGVWTPLLGAFVMLSSGIMFSVHAMAWSEPLFITLTLPCLALAASCAERPRVWALAACFALAVLASLTRYAGPAVVGAAFLGIVLFGRTRPLRRLIVSGVLAALACAGMVAWLLVTSAATRDTDTRALTVNRLRLGHFAHAADVMSKWVLPGRLPRDLRMAACLAGLIMVCVLGLVLFRRARRGASAASPRPTRLPQVLVLYVITYFGLFFASAVFLDATVGFDDRMLSPLYAALVVLAAAVGHRLFAGRRPRVIAIAVAVLGLAFAGRCAWHGAQWVRDNRNDGRQFASKAWRESALIRYINDLPDTAPIYTNGPGAVYLLTGRGAASIPEAVNPRTRRPNPSCDDLCAAMRERLERGQGVIVYFHGRARWYDPSADGLTRRLPLTTVERTEDGLVYAVSSTRDSAPE